MTTADEVNNLRKDNEHLMAEIGREGISLDIISMLKMRLDYVTDFLVGDDEQRQIDFAMGWEQTLNEALVEAAGQIAKAKLTVPMPGQLTLVQP